MSDFMAAVPVGKLTLEEALSSANDTRALVIGPGTLGASARVFMEQFPNSAAMIIADERTFRAAGRAVAEVLGDAGVTLLPHFIYTDPGLYAEYRFVEGLEASLREHKAIPIAVGSGTINDLTKLAAHHTGRPGYMCVATAASMDGYTAFGSSITSQGAKQTFECPAPRAVIADTEVIGDAPPPMNAWGYADLAAKITAGADWILADALEVEAIEPRAWSIIQGSLRDSLTDPAGAERGKPSAIGSLVEGLMLGGFAMQWSKSSRPASGAEHQFSHLWDMEHHVQEGVAPSHGFKVGVATLAITRFYEKLLARDFDTLDVDSCIANWTNLASTEIDVRRRFAGTDFVNTAIAETRAKQIKAADLRRQLQLLKSRWPEIRSRLRAQLLPSQELRHRLALVGAPTEPEQIGITRERLRDSFQRAYHIRRRFTVLDLAMRTGLLGELLAELFGPGAPWEIQAENSSS